MSEFNDKYIIIGGLLSSSLLGLALLKWMQLFQHRKMEQRFLGQRVFTPAEIKSMIERKDSLANQIFQKSEDGKYLLAKNIILQGTIASESHLTSSLSKNKNRVNLIVRSNFERRQERESSSKKDLIDQGHYSKLRVKPENIRTSIISDFQIESKGTKCHVDLNTMQRRYLRQSSAINDSEGNQMAGLNVKINIPTNRNRDTQCIINREEDFRKGFCKRIDRDCYDYFDSEDTSAIDNSNVAKWIWNRISMFLGSLLSILTLQDLRYAFCFRMEIERFEIGIRTGGVLGIVGDVSYDLRNGNISIVKPLRIIRNKIAYLSVLQKQALKCRTMLFITCVGSLAILGLTGYYLSNALKMRAHLMILGRRVQIPSTVLYYIRLLNPPPREEVKQTEQLLQLNQIQLQDRYLDPRQEIECVVCYHKTRCVVIRPCSHCCVCHDCYQLLFPKRQCPICKTKIIGNVLICMENRSF